MALLLLVLAAVLLGGWGAWRTFAPQPADAAQTLREQAAAIAALEQEAATLKRSDQVSRQANRDLQGTLAERDEEIAGLRADIAFYERFVGATAQRHGLSVHELTLAPQRDPQLWHFVATLTQNLNRGAVSKGRLQLSLEVSEMAGCGGWTGPRCASSRRRRAWTIRSSISSRWRATSCCRRG